MTEGPDVSMGDILSVFYYVVSEIKNRYLFLQNSLKTCDDINFKIVPKTKQK